MELTEVYVGLGGNIGDSQSILDQALHSIAALPQVCHLDVSGFYLTSPVSDIPQNSYVNGVCRFYTSYDAKSLFRDLQAIEFRLGKMPKAKNAPRIIDLDVLFFGTESYKDSELEIPHPRWSERLFVLIPLVDLADRIVLRDRGALQTIELQSYIQNFSNPHHEKVVLIKQKLKGGNINAPNSCGKGFFDWRRTAARSDLRALCD